MGVRLVRLPSATLRVREEGTGARLVVLACDPPNVIEHYDALASALVARGFRVVVFEPPGFGFSRQHPGASLALDDQVGSVRELLQVLPDADITILAFPCVAAYVALRLAIRHPALVDGLVLMQAPAWEDEMRWLDRVDRRRLLRGPLGGAVSRFAAPRIVRAWYAAAARAPDAMAPPALAALTAGARFPLAAAFRAMERERPSFVGAQQPTLLVWGAGDRSHRHSAPGSLRAVVPQAREVVFEGACHFPELEEPERFAAELDVLAARAGAKVPR